jgi:hypothetical protein
MDNKKAEEKFSIKTNSVNLDHYEDLGGQTMQKLGFGFWFVKNKRYLFLGLIGVLILISVIFYSKFFYNLYDYIRYTPEERKAREELSTVSVNPGTNRGASDLQQGQLNSFFSNSAYDFVVTIKNPNNNFFAHISYCFLDGETELSCSSNVVFPEENKYLISLANKLERKPANLKFILKSIVWERIDTKKYGDWKNYYQDRSNFDISQVNFNVDLSGSNANNLSFSIKNNSAYNYWELPLAIVLFNGNTVVGVNTYVLFELMSKESRDINFSWPGLAAGVSRAEVIPNLNILDSNNYINYR